MRVYVADMLRVQPRTCMSCNKLDVVVSEVKSGRLLASYICVINVGSQLLMQVAQFLYYFCLSLCRDEDSEEE